VTASSHLIPIYHKQPVTFVRGDGIWLYDDKGKPYLDALSGIGVCVLGHNHPAVTKTITEQASTLLQVPNNFFTPSQTALADKLCALTGLNQAYFSNSGTESNEAAIKMVLKFGTNKGIKHPKIIVMTNAFHGRSLGAWSASCDQEDSQFGPLIPSFIRVPFQDSDAIEKAISDDTVAIMVEPIIGKGGLLPASIDYLEHLRDLCDKHDMLLMFDEVQSGIGRTGKLFAYQHSSISPDILTTAKGLGNGIPIGAFIVSKKAGGLLLPGDHGSTQGGNPFGCQVALTVLDTLEKEGLIEHAGEIGGYLQTRLSQALSVYPQFNGIQGKGLMIGIKTKDYIEKAIHIGLDNGIVFNFTNKHTLRLLPPLILSKENADLIVEKMSACFAAFKTLP
jgi:acetylornithine/N-succinyldiaminopimelate aminotransferase